MADYFSRAVLIGYLHGVAVVLVIGQLAKLLGMDVDAQDPLAQLVEVVRELPGLHTTTLAVGGLCLAALLLLRWRAPKLARLKHPMRQALGDAGVLDLVGEGHVYPTVRAAVAAAEQD